SRVTQHKPLLQLAYVKPQLHPALSARRQLDRRRAAECRWIMILRAGRNANHDSFRIAADMNPVHFALPCRGKSVQRRADRHGNRYRSGMKQIQWPDIQRAACQIHARGCLGFNPQRRSSLYLMVDEWSDARITRRSRQMVANSAGSVPVLNKPALTGGYEAR